MKNIDPVEAVLAVIGVRPIISKEVEKVTMPQVREAHELASTVYKEAKKVVAGEKSSIALSSINYKKMLKDITEGYSEGQLLAMVEKFPAPLHALTAQFIIKAQQTMEILRGLFPVQTKETLLGTENLLPPALAVRRFCVSLDVLDNPLRVLAHISNGSLLKSQTAIVKQVYPTLSACITDALHEAGVDAVTAKQSFKLPTLVEIGSSTWLEKPRISSRLQNTLQQNFAKAAKPAGSNASSQQTGGQNSVIAKEALTQNQRANFPQTQKAG